MVIARYLVYTCSKVTTMNEISEIMHIIRITVRTQYHRAKQKLLHSYKKEVYDERSIKTIY